MIGNKKKLLAIQLFFAVAPKFDTIMEDVDVHVGETCHLAVVVEGKPDPDILWFKVIRPKFD